MYEKMIITNACFITAIVASDENGRIITQAATQQCQENKQPVIASTHDSDFAK